MNRFTVVGASLLLGFALLSATPARAAASLSFEDRVVAQAAIERVYHGHRTGETRPFEVAVPRSVLERRVRAYLAQSAALESLSHAALTPAQLDQELERIERDTRMPARLQELFDALGRDPVLVKECLIRPIVTDRLLRESWSRDAGLKASARNFDLWWDNARGAFATDTIVPVALAEPGPMAPIQPMSPAGSCVPNDSWNNASLDDYYEGIGTPLWTGSEVLIWGGDAGTIYNPTTDSWRAISAGNGLAQRQEFVSVWTGTEMIVWGGWNGLAVAFSDGARYDPSTDTWSPIAQAPYFAYRASGVWTGTEMIVYGGFTSASSPTPVGARYNPSTNTWAPLPSGNNARAGHAAVWTGSQMIVWGGTGDPINVWWKTGGRYDPSTNTWGSMTTTGAPTGSDYDRAVWTGTEMIVWSADDIIGGGVHHGRYDPATNTWGTISSTGAPPHRFGQSVVWSGSQLLVWAGCFNATCFNDGARYDPGSNLWTPIAPSPLEPGIYASVWTGTRMIAYGGPDRGGYRYDPAGDAWSAISVQQTTAPTARMGHIAAWTGAEMLIWGGTPSPVNQPIDSRPFAYDPALDSWFAGSSVGAPPPAALRGAWSGTELLVWDAQAATGAAYDRASDLWRALPTSGAPSSRQNAAVVWSGGRLLVWGGVTNGSTYLNTGARYSPSTNAWTAMTTSSAPEARSEALAVGAGSRLIVWGGRGIAGTLGSGGRYDVTGNKWSPMTTTGAPAPRVSASVVWSGTRMIVWGGVAGGSSLTSTGGLYDPDGDVWSATAFSGAPPGRTDHSAIWADEVMVVFGGYRNIAYGGATPFGFLKTGATYDPVADAWSPMTQTNGPRSRYGHSAVWTGQEMIVWGGQAAGRTGGRYGGGPRPDDDGDGLNNCIDVCPTVSNPAQTDSDGDGLGDACDPCPGDTINDPDQDALCGAVDNCPTVANPGQANGDGDALGDACDACPLDAQNDADADGICANVDNCAAVANSDQADADGDGKGNVCDSCPFDATNDADGDGACENVDNCPALFNAAQRDADADGRGDFCDDCPSAADPAQADVDGDGAGDACDCQPNDPNDRRPAAVSLTSVSKGGPQNTALNLCWSQPSGADYSAIYIGTVSQLRTGYALTCYGIDLPATCVGLSNLPPPGEAYYWLIQGRNDDCAGGPLGYDSQEREIVASPPVACARNVSDRPASSETPSFGTVSGNFTATQTSDNVVETITETLSSGGSPSKRFSLLSHQWTFTIGGGTPLGIEFHVEAWRSASTDGDDFKFSWSADGGPFVPITMPSLPLADNNTDLVVTLPTGNYGSVRIQVEDTDRSEGHQTLDAVTIDQMFIRVFP